ncbi:M15 family metallopeptidase [Weeksellaceae bacterium KMM 9724]|uniref:M15 family metallopeptidase n=1 Tax=Profundicola chukchiensis TaxID=2961959 RepID=UPI002439515A|nr:M15 family metallopeptidase [Profundicola chukchiensis]MDG4950770.1 M15 family metallopeptidase [Profundicola chukchiensis]
MKKIIYTCLVAFLISCGSENKELSENNHAIEEEIVIENDMELENEDEIILSSERPSGSINEDVQMERSEGTVRSGKGAINTINLGNVEDINKYLIGNLEFHNDDKFAKIPSNLSSKSIYVRKETLNAFLEMAKQAEKDGIKLTVISGARNFNHQKSIWERKWNSSNIKDPVARAKDILRYSSMPMTSRHHWGTDIDINSLQNSYFESGKGLKEYKWLVENGPKYGFCQVYTDKKEKNRKGYEMEKWHWSYMPLASQLLSQYKKELSYDQISGFEGSEVAKDLDVINVYVGGIADCN